MTAAPNFRIDVTITDLLANAGQSPPAPAGNRGLSLLDPVFPRFPERMTDPSLYIPPERHKWGLRDIYRTSRGWLFPYVRSRMMPGEFHPITAYLFIECKCNLDYWYCWSYNNKIRRVIKWLWSNVIKN